MIHIVNGDEVGKKLNVKGDIIVWRELYDMGPLHYSWNTEEMISRRAAFFEEKLEIPSPLFIRNCHNQEKKLEGIPEGAEICLWMEHDRYDQTMLMYLLHKLADKNVSLYMVTIDKYPGIEPFYGLGQLESKQLSELFLYRQKVSLEQLVEAQSGWRVYTSKYEQHVFQWLNDEEHPLPFLKQAMEIHLDYFPSAENGLNKVEHLMLDILNEKVMTFRDLFNRVSEHRVNDGLSDLHIAALLKEMCVGNSPLLFVEGILPNFEKAEANPRLFITTEGKDVLVNKQNRLELVGIDWWAGGVRLYKSRH
ncbi:DUF1835 domain-containing protein [Halobacillus mangrovi]|uniref:DUF1835 domain-containing protein n=1 Tax=Halobacillus mangrovi TaxID=402384 RepID=UPI003D97117D